MKAWLSRHVQTLIGSLGRLAQQPLASSLIILVMGIALALPACLNVLVKNAQAASGAWERALDVSVYLKPAVTVDAATRLLDKLKQRSDVKAARLIKADDALQEFREHSGFGEALQALSDNPLPNTIVLTPADSAASPAALQAMSTALQKLSDVDVVQLDTGWVQRYLAMLDTVRRLVVLVAILLGLGVVVIVGNTIRLDIQNRRDEIEVTKLVGGSDAFVRRPFLYCGVWYGLGGGLLAWLVVAIAVALLAAPVQRIAGLYGSRFTLSGLGMIEGATLLLIAVMLAWLGSFVAATRHLRAVAPR